MQHVAQVALADARVGGGAEVAREFLFPAQSGQNADGDHVALAVGQPAPAPDGAPGVLGQKALEVGPERVFPTGKGPLHELGAHHGAALFQPPLEHFL